MNIDTSKIVPQFDFKVCIRCMTYNHSKYIIDALNGFTMQKTNFPYIILLFDDASTDGEQDIIKSYVNRNFDSNTDATKCCEETEYANIFYARHTTNRNCYIVVYYLKYNHYQIKKSKIPYFEKWREKCKYEALCEGDDYWIDSSKLQKQVDFLDANLEYSMCFHNAINFYGDIPKVPEIFCNIIESRDVNLEEIIDEWIIPTASMLYRIAVVDNYPEWTKQIYSGDLTLQLIAYSKGKLYYMHRIMSLYRITYNSSSMTSEMRGKLDFVYEQHALLYKLYDEYTNFVYHDILNKRITLKEKDSRFVKYRRHGIVYAFIRMPIYFLYKLFKRLQIIWPTS